MQPKQTDNTDLIDDTEGDEEDFANFVAWYSEESPDGYLCDGVYISDLC